MPRMELRKLEDGSPFYYNTEGGGALSGFGTIRLYNTGSNLTIHFDSSNAHVDNDGSNVKIYNSQSNNMIYNGGSNVEIYSSGSLRELDNVSGHVTIQTSGNGNNWIANNGSNVSISTDAGNDFVSNDGGSYVTINTGNGKDTVNCNSAYNVTINSGDGNAFIQNLGSNSSINAGAGNDDIDVSGNNVTIRGGIGDDNVHNYNNPNASYVFEYADGDGHDVVTKNVKIYLLDSAQVNGFYIEGNDVIYNVGNGSIKILDGADVEDSFFINADAPEHDDDDIEGEMTGGAAPLTLYNGPEFNLDYLKQANVKPEDINFEGFLSYCDTDPIIQSILNEGKNSPYLSEYSPEYAEEVGELFKNIHKAVENNLQKDKEKQLSDETYKSNLEEISKSLDSLSNKLGMLDIAVAYAGGNLNPAYAIFVNFANIGVKWKEVDIIGQNLIEKYPNYKSHKIDYDGNPPNFYGWQGSPPFGMDVPISAYEDQLYAINSFYERARSRDRENNFDMYDEIDKFEFAKMTLDGTMLGAFEGLAIIGIGALVGASNLEIAIVGGLAGLYVYGDTTYKKTKYLQETHPGEQSFAVTYGEQLFGKKYGTFKNWLKGNNGGESPDLVDNYVITNGVVNATSSDVADDEILKINGGAGNDTIVNVKDNYLINSANGDDEISNIGDNVAVDSGNGNDYVANLGNNVKIVIEEGNNIIDNAGDNVSIDVGAGDDYIGNGGNFVVINAGNGADYIDNVGDSVQINTGAGDDDAENFGNNVIINTGDGVDYIIDFGSSNSINAGNGDDFIDIEGGYNNIIAYADGYGNDTIYGYNESDIIHLIGGTIKSTVASGEDLVINFETNSLTLKNAANPTVTYITENDVLPMLKYDGNYNYTGGNRALQNYSQSEQINLASDFTGIGLDDNNFYVNSSSGTLTIQNARDKVISYGDAQANLVAYSYMANGGGDIDGRNIDKAEIIIGANNQNNQIYAGSGGSSLWGGVGGADTLTGGEGYDEFFFAIGSGGDFIQNAGDTDLINLLGVTLEQIAAANVSELSVNITLVDGSYLNVAGNSNVGYQVEGKIYACNHSTGEWYEK